MAETITNTTLKRRRNRYRLVIMNDDTFEEVIKFRLSRLSVYMGLSAIFVLMVGLTVALLVLTPLKYYIPGSSENGEARRELQTLKIRTDSMEQALKYKDTYLDGLKKALGAGNAIADTATLKIPKTEVSND
ncbi:MAG: hypothetical protein JO072_14235 [Parafilimonas sp.]|nr:hypothetical protein [Parafilimonas sp.]